MGRNCRFFCTCTFLVVLLSAAAIADTTGRVLGRVTDPSGAIVPNAKVTLVNEDTGLSRTAQTDGSGDYNFIQVPVGNYRLETELTGFKKSVQRGIVLQLNQVLTLNVSLALGGAQEVVDVTSEAPQVDTTSTQLGAVVNDRAVSELPLNARDTYQFLQLQPGVQSQLGSSGSTFYGSDKAGSVSVNGGRGRANNFNVNGGDANDQFVNLPTVQPSPDTIEEFKVITNTFDAEYGRNSGSVVNVVTKSGTNDLHGNVYEYFRNTNLNAQGYFNTVKPQSNQNQFGGTLGGPIKKDRAFFFGSYEGRRVRQGVSGQNVPVPDSNERQGIFPTVDPQGNPIAFGGTLTDPFLADVINARGNGACGAAISASTGAPAAAGTPWAQIFPNNVIPTSCMDPVAANLMNNYIPTANRAGGYFQGVPASKETQDQFTTRFDYRINKDQNFSAYYYFTDDNNFQPFNNFQAGGATVPGFGGLVDSRYQQVNVSHTWTIGNSLVNEARFTYMREGQGTFQHPQTTGAIPSFCSGNAQTYCFNGTTDVPGAFTANGLAASNPKYGITPGLPSQHTSLPFITISGGAVIGNNFEGELPQVGNTFSWSDNVSWVKGKHTMKFGAQVQRSLFDQTLYFNVNGDYTINNSGLNAIPLAAAPGSNSTYSNNYPEFLLGLADTYSQGSAQAEHVRSTGVYLFAQDSWKVKPNLTLNYGLRWELTTPLTDILGHVQTFRPGQNSTKYPCTNTPIENCPTGLVVPGDQNVPAGLTSTYYRAFAPRVGLAYSPDFDSGPLAKLFGKQGTTSIRTGWGIFYNPMEQLVLEQFGAEPPFGSSPSFNSTLFNTPFVQQNGTVIPNGFNGILSPPAGQDPGWSNYKPILLFGEFQPHLRTQYSVQYNLTIQRELARDLMFQIGYVGSQGHRLLASHDINASNPQTCLDIINIANNNPAAVTDFSGNPTTCAPVAEDSPFLVTVPSGTTFHLPNGQTVAGTGQTLHFVGLRPYSSPNCNWNTGAGCPADGTPVFTNIFAQDTIANSAYNALQLMLEKRFSHGLQLQAAYTWSKSLDWASSFEETLNPFDFKASRALSLFNAPQRFVINYYWELPIGKHEGWVGKLVDNWSISGITQFQSGFPIRLQTQNDNELINSLFFIGTGAPQLTGNLHVLNPKSSASHLYLDPSQFSDPALGSFATTPRSICCGPGTNQWDMTFSKRIPLSESKYFQFRTDIFNVFNKTQFFNPDGNFSNSTFGQVLQARDPRLIQLALKFYF